MKLLTWSKLWSFKYERKNFAIMNKDLISFLFTKWRIVFEVKRYYLPAPGVVVIAPRGLCITEMFGYTKTEEGIKVKMQSSNHNETY